MSRQVIGAFSKKLLAFTKMPKKLMPKLPEILDGRKKGKKRVE
jgi:hypothetical protein